MSTPACKPGNLEDVAGDDDDDDEDDNDDDDDGNDNDDDGNDNEGGDDDEESFQFLLQISGGPSGLLTLFRPCDPGE